MTEREHGGPFSSVTELAARCSTQRDALEKLAWAGACDELVADIRSSTGDLGRSNGRVARAGVIPEGIAKRARAGNAGAQQDPPEATSRRKALWLLGASVPGTNVPK